LIKIKFLIILITRGDFTQAEFSGDSYDTIQALAAIVESFIPAE
jgi:hypothetical protein